MQEDLTMFLKSNLHFSNLTEAEASLRTIHQRLLICLAQNDWAAVQLCRSRIREAQRRAYMLSRNRKIDPFKRQQKEEIHHWFTLWLQSPGTFFPWLELRKETVEYRRLATGQP